MAGAPAGGAFGIPEYMPPNRRQDFQSKDYTQEILSLEYLNMTVDSIYNEEEILDTINVRLKENTED